MELEAATAAAITLDIEWVETMPVAPEHSTQLRITSVHSACAHCFLPGNTWAVHSQGTCPTPSAQQPPKLPRTCTRPRVRRCRTRFPANVHWPTATLSLRWRLLSRKSYSRSVRGLGIARDSEHKSFSCILAPVLMLFFFHVFRVLLGIFIFIRTQKLGNLVDLLPYTIRTLTGTLSRTRSSCIGLWPMIILPCL